MSLNIKNDETCRLASELANLTGETMTGAITVALQERLEREQRSRSIEARMEAIEAIAQRCSKLLRDGGPSAVDHGDFLYDEHGAPK
ncbi:MAG: type II toxin-antitoxin system VapB family antitoxin [bacterium]|nr:type II toxin-antitoxin system VapB family antitoxin [bacterium]